VTPKEYYQQELAAGRISLDEQQQPVIDALDNIARTLQARAKKTSWFSRFQKKEPVIGLYLWGSVGIGKTFLMDCFYHCVQVPKLRLHFHQFLLRIHNELSAIQGQKNPLQVIAKKIANEVSVICFDEFFVSNIADAMILGELFQHLFDNGVTLITSSNIPPDLLYKEGLQRERFLPAIALIKQYTRVIHLHSMKDYRRQHIRQSGVYYTPLNENALHEMDNAFTHFSSGAAIEYDPIVIYERNIPVIKRAGPVIWFDFDVICGRPRCQNDYLFIAKNYHTIMIQNLRAIQTNENDLILSFIYLVDILYDAHCRLVISCAVKPSEIYTMDNAKQPFARTLSRLIEMQSESYVYPDSINHELTHL
jgi:cell division protein ZapE